MKDFILKNKYILLLGILCTIAAVIFCGHYDNILLDVGREIYYPEQILKGKVLYKDLFNIYGPFSYLFNAFLYKIFGVKLGVLYFAGIVSSYLLVFGVYALAKKYLSEFLSFCIGLFIIVSGVCVTHIFNYTLPYSYGMLYGAVGALYSVLALVKYTENKNTGYLYLASLLGGFCIANKYDFIFYGIFLFIVALLSKNKKVVLNFITCFMAVPLLCGLVLFLQKLGMNDVISAVSDIKALMSSKALHYFYTNQGVFFSPRIILIWLIHLVKTGLCFIGLIQGYNLFEKRKIVGSIVFLIFACLLFAVSTPACLVFMIPLMAILMIIKRGELKNNPQLLVLLISALTLSTKSIWAFLTMNYGNYLAPIFLTAFLAVLFIFIDKKYEKVIAMGLLVLCLNGIVFKSYTILDLNGRISTPKGTIYTSTSTAAAVEDLMNKLEVRKAQQAVIYPEGLIVNFLTDLETHGYYNSLIPVYAESLGEKRFIDNLEEMKPDYVVFNNLNMREYNRKFIGSDYAIDLKDYLLDNYIIADNNIGNSLKFILFRRK